MKQRRTKNTHLALRTILIAGALLVFAGSVLAGITQAPRVSNRPVYVPNQVLVTLRPGVSDQTVQSVAAELGGSIVRAPKYSHTYTVQVPGQGTPADVVMANKVSLARKYPGVQSFDYNMYRYPLETPNDEFYNADPWGLPQTPTFLTGQWQLQPGSHIYAPEAWDIQKGSKDVVVCVIDTGVRDRFLTNSKGVIVRTPHPDLAERILPGEDFADTGSADKTNPGPGPSEVIGGTTASHGTHVAGIIAAQADNWIGVAGLCWNNVWILPYKVAADEDLTMTADVVTEAIYAAINWRMYPTGLESEPVRVGVINLSLGGYGYTAAEEDAVRKAVQSGIVIVAAAGNDWMSGPYAPSYPAAFDDVICVGATGYTDEATLFSNRGRAMDIVAPGMDILSTVFYLGDATIDHMQNPPSYVPSYPVKDSAGNYIKPNPMPTWPDIYGNGYDYMPGTSMASPCVAAAAALLLSHGLPANEVREVLCQTATPKGLGRPNDTYGWGLVNVEAALRRASIDAKISSPAKGSVVASTKPRFRIDFRHASLDSIRVWIDGTPADRPIIGGSNPVIPDWQKYYYILDPKAGKSYLLFDYPVDLNQGVNGVHTITVTASSDITFENPPPAPLSVTDTVQFRVQPQTMGAGWRLFSIPAKFDQMERPEDVLGTTGTLARWNYANTPFGEYALYSLDRARTDDEATFAPTSAYANSLVHPSTQTEATPAAGLGYWLYLPSGSTATLPEGFGQDVSDAPYVIGLYYGWNMVGNPFAFPVDWSNVVVEYAGMRATAEEAVTNGWISDSIYRYDTTYRRYNFKNVASALLIPWEAEWVKVKVRTPETGMSMPTAWSEEFNDGVLDMTEPEPAWFTGVTFGSVTESGGMLRLTGVAGQPSYEYVTNSDFLVYGDFILDAKLYLANAAPTVSGGPATTELRFRADGVGTGYSLAFIAGSTPNTICLRDSATNQVIGTATTNTGLVTGSVLYANVTCVGTRIKVRVGTQPGLADVADWEVNDSTYSLPGCFRLVNDGMTECRWDYIRYRPVSMRPPDVKLIVPPNAYTGPIQ